MQIDNAPRAGFLVQAVDILRHSKLDQAFFFKLFDNLMGVGRFRSLDCRPSSETPQPIALPRTLMIYEVLMLYRSAMLPIAISISIGRYAAANADTSACQNN